MTNNANKVEGTSSGDVWQIKNKQTHFARTFFNFSLVKWIDICLIYTMYTNAVMKLSGISKVTDCLFRCILKVLSFPNVLYGAIAPVRKVEQKMFGSKQKYI